MRLLSVIAALLVFPSLASGQVLPQHAGEKVIDMATTEFSVPVGEVERFQSSAFNYTIRPGGFIEAEYPTSRPGECRYGAVLLAYAMNVAARPGQVRHGSLDCGPHSISLAVRGGRSITLVQYEQASGRVIYRRRVGQ